ncbi:hypothetical protein FSP39_020390 [Pinctada imbricata]|uniref:Uncharacterized protein n=1 Tax=Pinctada imbricata TaxID=66713 RepID=A0AA88YIZ0_PINIB|nr:hypothetical protein FSP39_020390 [Pinctada imbricata]
MALDHRGGYIALIVAMVIVWIVMVTFNGLAGGEGQKIGIFKNSTGDIADVFILDITPAGWTFSIWGFIYTWQALWLVYALTSICRKTGDGHYIYTLPITPPVIYVVYIVNNLANIAWLFVWDSQLIIWSLVVISLTPITLYVCLFFSYRGLYYNLGMLAKKGATKEPWLVRFVVQNAFSFYAAWTTVATLLNVAMVMVYKGNVANDVACTIVLAILTFLIITYFILDVSIWDKFTRYTFTPNITFVVAVAGAISKNYDIDNKQRNSIFLVVLESIASLLLLFKLLVMVYRHIRRPIVPDSKEYEPTV